MNIVKKAMLAASFATVTFLVGCGGVSEAQMQELRNLRQDVNSKQTELNQLKDQRTSLEREIAEKNAKLQQCEKDKAETKANLEKLPK